MTRRKTDAPRKPKVIRDIYGILIECRDEAEQRRLYEEMRRREFKVACKIL